MKRYEFTLDAKSWQTATFVVEAENEEAATEQAEELIEDDDFLLGLEWAGGDEHDGPPDLYCNGEADEPA